MFVKSEENDADIRTKNVKQDMKMKHLSKFMKDMILNKIEKVSDIENKMRYFNVNHVEKRKIIQEREIRKGKDTMRNILRRNYVRVGRMMYE